MEAPSAVSHVPVVIQNSCFRGAPLPPLLVASAGVSFLSQRIVVSVGATGAESGAATSRLSRRSSSEGDRQVAEHVQDSSSRKIEGNDARDG